MDAYEAADDVARTSYGRLVALLAATTRDLAAAEDALSDAFLAALRTWPERGIPDRPEAWMLTTARRAAIGAHRRRAVADRAVPTLAVLADEYATPGRADLVPDKRLELMFACAHPAIDPDVHTALMLQTVLGLDAARIAEAFLVRPATLGQRLVRAKARIRVAGVPFAVPTPDQLPERATAVLDAIYAAYGTGWDDPAGHDPRRSGLTEESIRLATIVTDLLASDPEAHGLLALLLHSRARQGARRGDDGRFVPLGEQEPSRWSRDDIERAEGHLSAALALDHLGRYQLHAAIQSVHNRRAATGSTDWPAIARLYDGLVAFDPSVGTRVARAAAIAEASGPAAGLAALDAIDAVDAMLTYQPHWVLRAELLHRTGQPVAAAAAAGTAIGLTRDPAVDVHLRARYIGRATG